MTTFAPRLRRAIELVARTEIALALLTAAVALVFYLRS